MPRNKGRVNRKQHNNTQVKNPAACDMKGSVLSTETQENENIVAVVPDAATVNQDLIITDVDMSKATDYNCAIDESAAALIQVEVDFVDNRKVKNHFGDQQHQQNQNDMQKQWQQQQIVEPVASDYNNIIALVDANNIQETVERTCENTGNRNDYDISYLVNQNSVSNGDHFAESSCSKNSIESSNRDDIAVSKEMLQLEEKFREQQSEIERLMEENEQLKKISTDSISVPISEVSAEIYEVQMAALEKTITQLQREVNAYRDRLSENEDIARNALSNLKRDLTSKLEKLTKQYEVSEKEKEMMVVKYAQSEKNVLTLKKLQEETDRKLKENAREKDILVGKIRTLTNDRARFSQAIEAKTTEVANFQKEHERLKEEISSKDIKVKWAQNKLKTEIDSHKETQCKLDKVQQKLTETREEAEQIRRDCQEMIKAYQESEEIKSNSLDLQLREKETELKLERQEKSDQEEVYLMIRKELDAIKKKHKLSIDENNAFTIKVQSLERERLDYEQNLSKLKENLNSCQQEIVDLHAKVAEMDNLTSQINREKEKVVANQLEIERIRQTNAELQIDMEACRRKEGELLEFTERLTSKNVTLQSEYNCLEAKFQAQEREYSRVSKLLDEMDQKNSLVEVKLTDEQHQRKQETQLLARKLAERTKTIENLNLKLDEQINENNVLKRRNAASIRELTREIQGLRRRIDNSEPIRSGGVCDGSNLGSRTSSTGSLDTMNYSNFAPPNSTSVKQGNPLQNGVAQETRQQLITDLPAEQTQQMLIERIVKLQRSIARKNEKIEFLEEHVNQMLHELKKKTKVIQNYVMRDDSGVLTTSSMDQNKVDLARRGGIMASLYTSQQVDGSMTLDLALEISRKLQAVLEDTLLKNITLKENIKTLGEEIARLTSEKHQRFK